ncbi:hypothetical protein ACHHYP_10382 [Achlya hypogyna]|uniref:Uncharacterized protein n=1 Tax=Achlya hypogyna TaxID=1202772 RepID=A0A1V9YLI5_ACHHY|nr:hypothetical protein ACHHYP_10382 [Achlya hypogyna]
MGLQKNFAGLKAVFRRSSNQSPPRLSEAEYERLRMELEDILALYEPSQIGTAADLLKHYEGLEAELVDCYRQYYFKESSAHPNQPTSVHPARPASADNNNETYRQNERGTTFRKRLSLPTPTLSAFLPEKLRYKSTKKCGGVKMEGICGPEPLTYRSPRSKTAAPGHRFRLPKKSSISDVLQKVTLRDSTNQRYERKPVKSRNKPRNSDRDDEAPLQSGNTMSFPAKCLDTGEDWFMDEVNQEVLDQQKEYGCRRRPTFREKVIVFLQRHDMAAIDSVDTLLSYGGKTNDEIWNDLQIKYKVNQRSRLLQLFQKYDPDKAPHVDSYLIEYADDVEDMIAYYKNKYARQQAKEAKRADPCTWSPGEPNSYQLLPGGQ